MRLWLIPGEFGYGGGYAFIVCAETEESARAIVSAAMNQPLPAYYNSTSHPITDFVDLGVLQQGDFRLVDYYE